MTGNRQIIALGLIIMNEEYETVDMYNILANLMSVKDKRNEIERVIKNHSACSKLYARILIS